MRGSYINRDEVLTTINELFIRIMYAFTAKNFIFLIIFSGPLLLHNSQKNNELYTELNMKMEMRNSIFRRKECAT
jgi:hypothetical protein